MPDLSVVIIAGDSEQRAVLQVLVDGTSVARTAHAAANYPAAATDPLIPRMHALHADVILVDVPIENPSAALNAIELLRQEVPETAASDIAATSLPHRLLRAMRPVTGET